MKATRVLLVLLLGLGLLALLVLRTPRCIFTCTTFFDFAKQDKWAAFCRAMDSLLEETPDTLGQIHEWLIVNEYSSTQKQDWAATVKQRYPFMTFIQKTEAQKGQAASMNLILEAIQPYELWIHWEESWFCRAPVLQRALTVMRADPTIAQLQFTQLKNAPNWMDETVDPDRIRCETLQGVEFCRIAPSRDVMSFLSRDPHDVEGPFFANWPLYSLLPSINRVSANRVGPFSTDPTLWPIKFEWDYARRWFLAGGTKAVFPDGPVIRTEHVSTYS